MSTFDWILVTIIIITPLTYYFYFVLNQIKLMVSVKYVRLNYKHTRVWAGADDNILRGIKFCQPVSHIVGWQVIPVDGDRSA